MDDLFPLTFKFFIIIESQSSALQKSNWFKYVYLYYQEKQKELTIVDLNIRNRKQAFTWGKDQNLDLKNNRIHNENS